MTTAAPKLVANARMYSVTPTAAATWTALFHHLAATTGLDLEIVEHPFPLLVADLWKRTDLACAFMCGWPWAREGLHMQPVAAPIPAHAGSPRYWSDIVVRTDHPARTLHDLAGARIGFTLLDSQSGFSALRTHLHRLGPAAPAFADQVGPLTTPRRAIEAVAEHRADAAPIDSYAHALLRRHLPDLTARVRVLDRTPPTPCPLLVASPATDPAIVATLGAALRAIHDPALLDPLDLLGFTDPLPPEDYMQMEHAARDAEAAGIHDLTPFLRPATAA